MLGDQWTSFRTSSVFWLVAERWASSACPSRRCSSRASRARPRLRAAAGLSAGPLSGLVARGFGRRPVRPCKPGRVLALAAAAAGALAYALRDRARELRGLPLPALACRRGGVHRRVRRMGGRTQPGARRLADGEADGHGDRQRDQPLRVVSAARPVARRPRPQLLLLRPLPRRSARPRRPESIRPWATTSGVALFYALARRAPSSASRLPLASRAPPRATAASARPSWSASLRSALAVALGNLAGGTQLLRHGLSLPTYNWFDAFTRDRRDGERVPVLQLPARRPPRARDGDAVRARHRRARAPAGASPVRAVGGCGRPGRSRRRSRSMLGSLSRDQHAGLPHGGVRRWPRRGRPSATSRGDRRLRLLAWWGVAVGARSPASRPVPVRASRRRPAGSASSATTTRSPALRRRRRAHLRADAVAVGRAFVARLRMPARVGRLGTVGAVFVLTLLAPAQPRRARVIVSATAIALGASVDGRSPVPERFFWLLVAVGIGLVATGRGRLHPRRVRTAPRATASTPSSRPDTRRGTSWRSPAPARCSGARAGSGGGRAASGWPCLVGLVALAVAYPLAGTYSRAHASGGPLTLDGMALAERSSAGRRRAIGWLRRRVAGDADDRRVGRSRLRSGRRRRASRRSPGSRLCSAGRGTSSMGPRHRDPRQRRDRAVRDDERRALRGSCSSGIGSAMSSSARSSAPSTPRRACGSSRGSGRVVFRSGGDGRLPRRLSASPSGVREPPGRSRPSPSSGASKRWSSACDG